jgi:hypothetical protein
VSCPGIFNYTGTFVLESVDDKRLETITVDEGSVGFGAKITVVVGLLGRLLICVELRLDYIIKVSFPFTDPTLILSA